MDKRIMSKRFWPGWKNKRWRIRW